MPTNPTVERLLDAINRHDPAGMAALMTPDYRSDQPVHPGRSFVGNKQVIKNWTAVFASIPDIRAELVTEVTGGTTSLSEWSFSGRHVDGSDFAMRGVIVAGIEDGLIQWQRLYVDPVDQSGEDIEQSVTEIYRPPES